MDKPVGFLVSRLLSALGRLLPQKLTGQKLVIGGRLTRSRALDWGRSILRVLPPGRQQGLPGVQEEDGHLPRDALLLLPRPLQDLPRVRGQHEVRRGAQLRQDDCPVRPPVRRQHGAPAHQHGRGRPRHFAEGAPVVCSYILRFALDECAAKLLHWFVLVVLAAMKQVLSISSSEADPLRIKDTLPVYFRVASLKLPADLYPTHQALHDSSFHCRTISLSFGQQTEHLCRDAALVNCGLVCWLYAGFECIFSLLRLDRSGPDWR